MGSHRLFGANFYQPRKNGAGYVVYIEFQGKNLNIVASYRCQFKQVNTTGYRLLATTIFQPGTLKGEPNNLSSLKSLLIN